MKKIEFLSVFPLYKRDFETLHPDIAPMVALTSFAVSEINVLLKIFLGTARDATGFDEVDLAAHIQNEVITRILSAKLFEFHKLMEMSSKNTVTCAELRTIILEETAKFHTLQPASGFKLAKLMRNKAANHYDLEAARKNLEFVSDRADFSLYLHKVVGNAYFPMGEEVMTLGLVQRAMQTLDDVPDPHTGVKLLSEWNRAAARWVYAVHNRIVLNLVLPQVKGRKGSQKMLWLDPDMVAEVNEGRIPLFVRVSKD